MSNKLNNPIWVMSSAYDKLSLEELIETAVKVGAQGIDLCVFRKDGTREDHTATHLEYDEFSPETANRLIDQFNANGLQLSLGAFENMIGGDPEQRIKNQNHLLKLIRIAYLLGGDTNNVKVGTFVGYNHELGNEIDGFQKNLEKYKEVFGPIVRYAESLGVTILYENCPMEGWRSSRFTSTYNNLPATLAARKLMYAMIPSKAHGEIYDPSHDVWQNTDPVEVIKLTDISRLHRIHVKTTRNLSGKARVEWGGMYPMQTVDASLAQAADVAVPLHDWDRHHYEAMLPGFGGSDSMDWRGFVDTLQARGYSGPFEIENEAKNSKDTGNFAATNQGFTTCINFLAPMLWDLDVEKGYTYRNENTLKNVHVEDIPVVTIDQL
ncbi:AP endonuclease, family 2 [Sphingobacterium spiritivorum ATCC 33300]|uniref:AP endonuclease, family 2 n=1 Tax=Sphingobacterium spiritivorum ATCC 33300 TaxID=525372 RepID=C2FYZ6_SPHSI|nr:sugar phosphate isomerase/epimerase [Sphingobacterium spiritivorum]EEI91838.1 AP endonuclease, family 2 [Sphingobacterium spiritivorum ATCC 33300]QQS97014.1 sugar phosphate isomerase/epimerase [Sphingobacterium spiritivorum]